VREHARGGAELDARGGRADEVDDTVLAVAGDTDRYVLAGGL
jgi:hypothetical protein